MVRQLVQIKIDGNGGGTLPVRKYYQCGLNGRYRAYLVGIVWADKSGSTADNKLITIQSDCFRMPYGSVSQSILFCNRGEHNLATHNEYPINIEVMGNDIDLSITASVDYTGIGNNSFTFGVLSFAVEKVDE